MLGPGNRRIYQTPVIVILDFAGSLADRQGNIPRLHTDAVRACLRFNVIFDTVSYIGVRDTYAYFSDHFAEGNRTDSFFKTIESWMNSNNLPRAGAPEMGYIRHVKVVNDRCGHPHQSQALEAEHGIRDYRTTGGKDWHAFHNEAAAIVDDHAGANLACIEVGLISYLLEVGPNASHTRPKGDARVFRSFMNALDDLVEKINDPVIRLDLETRQKNIFTPDRQVHTRTACPNAADPYYSTIAFKPWRISELVRWKSRGGTRYRSNLSPVRQ